MVKDVFYIGLGKAPIGSVLVERDLPTDKPFVYAIWRHRVGWDRPIIIYIGMTINGPRRPKSHFRRAGKNSNMMLARHFSKALSMGERVGWVVVSSGLDKSTVVTEEIEWIKRIGRENLCNNTDGGEGHLNPTDENRIRMSAVGRRSVVKTNSVKDPETGKSIASIRGAKTAHAKKDPVTGKSLQAMAASAKAHAVREPRTGRSLVAMKYAAKVKGLSLDDYIEGVIRGEYCKTRVRRPKSKEYRMGAYPENLAVIEVISQNRSSVGTRRRAIFDVIKTGMTVSEAWPLIDSQFKRKTCNHVELAIVYNIKNGYIKLHPSGTVLG